MSASQILLCRVCVVMMLVACGFSQACNTGADDFAVKYSGGAVFTVAQSNSTCICPYFQGNGTHLNIEQNSYVRNLTSRMATFESRIVSLELKAGGLYVGQSLNANCLDYANSTDCTGTLLCSPQRLRCLLPANASCNATVQCMDSMVCAASKCTPVFTSCASFLAAFPSAATGVYTLQINGASTPVYCEMSRAGGGWNLAMNVNTSDGNVVHHDNTQFWVSDTLYGGAFGVAASGLMTDYKHVGVFGGFVANQLLIVVHKAGVVQFHRAWQLLTPATVRVWFNRPDGSQYQLTSSVIDNFFPGGSFATDGVIAANTGEMIFANTATSPNANDFNRLSRAPDTTTGDNCGWGLGTKYDTNYATYSRPWADAIAKVCGTTWGGGWIGTDIQPGNQYGSASGHNVAYAIYVR